MPDPKQTSVVVRANAGVSTQPQFGHRLISRAADDALILLPNFNNSRAEQQNEKIFSKFYNGDTYFGEFEDGQFQGQGTYKYANGDEYIGEFKNGSMNGHGVFKFADQDEYIGQFQNGTRTGHGIY
tara:strand:+ start:133 stop:510 length:378 start_codon:yes stop_codon:yes gene_type:complete